MAKYKKQYSAFDVAKVVFKNRPEPLRFLQAAQLWHDDLDIREQVDAIMLAGSTGSVDSKERKLQVLQQIYEDTGVEARDRITAIKVSAELQGEIVKIVDKTVKNDGPPQMPTFIFKKYENVA